MTLLRRRSFLRVLHMSVTCLADVKTIHNMHHVLQVNVSVTCPRPCQSRHAGTRLRAVPASASHASQPKRTKKNGHELALLIVFLIWMRQVIWRYEARACQALSGNMFDPNSALCEQVSGWTFLSLSQKDWLSRSNCCQRFPHWLPHSSPTKPQNPCLFAMLCGFEKVKVPSHPAHLIFVSIVSRITFHAHVMCLCCLHHLQISNIWSWRKTHEKHRKALRLLAEANMSLRWGLSRGTLYLDSQAKHDMGNQNQELQVCGGLQHLFNVRHANKHANTACSTSSSSDSGRSAGATKPVPDIKTQHLQSAAQTVSPLKNTILHVGWRVMDRIRDQTGWICAFVLACFFGSKLCLMWAGLWLNILELVAERLTKQVQLLPKIPSLTSPFQSHKAPKSLPFRDALWRLWEGEGSFTSCPSHLCQYC